MRTNYDELSENLEAQRQEGYLRELIGRELRNADALDLLLIIMLGCLALGMVILVLWFLVSVVVEILTSFSGILAVVVLGYIGYKVYPVIRKVVK